MARPKNRESDMLLHISKLRSGLAEVKELLKDVPRKEQIEKFDNMIRDLEASNILLKKRIKDVSDEKEEDLKEIHGIVEEIKIFHTNMDLLKRAAGVIKKLSSKVREQKEIIDKNSKNIKILKIETRRLQQEDVLKTPDINFKLRRR